ncbi:MAG TPA: hypothetical protein DCM87_18815, partial [Planctomycetes bacterium]|nr:hypothetical protein [Planctomycetota bacterium]
PASGAIPLDVRLSGAVVDIGGAVASWAWEVDGAPAGEGSSIAFTFTTIGDHEAVLRVVDDDGLEGVGSAVIRAGLDAPAAGNVNGDLRIDIGDPIFLLTYLFRTGTPPLCSPITACADVNADGRIDIGDPIYLLAYLFGGGPPPGMPKG